MISIVFWLKRNEWRRFDVWTWYLLKLFVTYVWYTKTKEKPTNEINFTILNLDILMEDKKFNAYQLFNTKYISLIRNSSSTSKNDVSWVKVYVNELGIIQSVYMRIFLLQLVNIIWLNRITINVCMWLFTHEESVLLPGKQNKQGTLRDCNI